MKIAVFFLVGSIVSIALEKRNFWDREIIGVTNMGNFVRFDTGDSTGTKGNFDGGPYHGQNDYHDR